MSAEDEWEKMVKEALNEPTQAAQIQAQEDKREEDTESDESGEYVSSESSGEDTISTSSCDSQEWAPTKPRFPINIPMKLGEENVEPDDAEEAVRAAGIGIQSLSIDSTPQPRSDAFTKTPTIIHAVTKSTPMMLPAFYEKLQKSSKRFGSDTLYSLVTPISLVPYRASINSQVNFIGEDVPISMPNTLANIMDVPNTVIDSKDVTSIPFLSLLTILSSTLGCQFKQCWIIPFFINETSTGKYAKFGNPLHDDPIDRLFAHYKLAYLGAHSIYTNQGMSVNGTDLMITNHLPALLSFKGNEPLTSALASFNRSEALCYNIDLFGMSLRGSGSCPTAESEYHKGKNVMAHILKRLLNLSTGEYLLVHRSDEALCYVCSASVDGEKDINLKSEMPPPITLSDLNHDP